MLVNVQIEQIYDKYSVHMYQPDTPPFLAYVP